MALEQADELEGRLDALEEVLLEVADAVAGLVRAVLRSAPDWPGLAAAVLEGDEAALRARLGPLSGGGEEPETGR